MKEKFNLEILSKHCSIWAETKTVIYGTQGFEGERMFMSEDNVPRDSRQKIQALRRSLTAPLSSSTCQSRDGVSCCGRGCISQISIQE